MDDVRATFETNVFGVMAMVQAFTPLLIPTRGLIINIASLSAVLPYIFGSVYCATKGAVVSYSRCLRQELRPFGVRVTIAMTGTVRSNTTSHGHRALPVGSLYARVKDLFQKRLVFSQNNATMDTTVYARLLVANALAPETPFWLRGWLGRLDWFWAGGFVRSSRWGIRVGEWLTDMLSYRRFELRKLEDIVNREGAIKKLT